MQLWGVDDELLSDGNHSHRSRSHDDVAEPQQANAWWRPRGNHGPPKQSSALPSAIHKLRMTRKGGPFPISQVWLFPEQVVNGGFALPLLRHRLLTLLGPYIFSQELAFLPFLSLSSTHHHILLFSHQQLGDPIPTLLWTASWKYLYPTHPISNISLQWKKLRLPLRTSCKLEPSLGLIYDCFGPVEKWHNASISIPPSLHPSCPCLLLLTLPFTGTKLATTTPPSMKRWLLQLRTRPSSPPGMKRLLPP